MQEGKKKMSTWFTLRICFLKKWVPGWFWVLCHGGGGGGGLGCCSLEQAFKWFRRRWSAHRPGKGSDLSDTPQPREERQAAAHCSRATVCCVPFLLHLHWLLTLRTCLWNELWFSWSHQRTGITASAACPEQLAEDGSAQKRRMWRPKASPSGPQPKFSMEKTNDGCIGKRWPQSEQCRCLL